MGWGGVSAAEASPLGAPARDACEGSRAACGPPRSRAQGRALAFFGGPQSPKQVNRFVHQYLRAGHFRRSLRQPGMPSYVLQ